MSKNIEVDAAKLAGLQIDMLQKLRDGQMTIKQMEWFNNLSNDERDYLLEKRFEKINLFDPKKFFKTKSGLRVPDGFKKNILSAAKPIEKTQIVSISSFDLKRLMNGTQIRTELSKNHVFEVSEFCLYLANKVQKQSEEEEEEFLLNGEGNLHFVYGKKHFMVCVHRNITEQRWCINTYHPNSHRWNIGSRVFFPTYI